jgi:hypothetical protein
LKRSAFVNFYEPSDSQVSQTRLDSLHKYKLHLVGTAGNGQAALVQAKFCSQDIARVDELKAAPGRKKKGKGTRFV